MTLHIPVHLPVSDTDREVASAIHKINNKLFLYSA